MTASILHFLSGCLSGDCPRKEECNKRMIANKPETLDLPRFTEEVEELSLFLPSRQFLALAEAAESEGMTMGQYMRRLLDQALTLSLPERRFHST